ncbi:MAG: twin-arginine translocase subunit TatC [Deltaproteobacteria bacterium]
MSEEEFKEESKMPFLEHLAELRKRMLWSIAAIGVFFIPAYSYSEELFNLLMRPIIANLPEGSSLIFTAPAEGFTTYLKVSLFAALVMAFPFVLLQIWKFIGPALYREEKRIALPFIFFGTIFFLAGGAFCYFITAPTAFKFLLGEYSSEYVKAMPTIANALSFFISLIFGFGLVFEFPLVSFLLARLGIINSQMLRSYRKYAILISTAVAAVITPTTDAISMMFMLVPLIVFYELGIIVAWVFGKKKSEPADEQEAQG